MKNYIQSEIPFEIEEWRPVVGYEGLYEVSDYGRVRSLGHYVFQKNKGTLIKRFYSGRILTPGKCKNGYLRVDLNKKGKTKHYLVHRLVAEAFIPNDNPEYKTQCNHINEDKSDNRACNLNWMTPKENVNWGSGIERKAKSISKAVKQMDLDGNVIAIWKNGSIAAESGFNYKNINACCNGKRNSHKGFLWEFA